MRLLSTVAPWTNRPSSTSHQDPMNCFPRILQVMGAIFLLQQIFQELPNHLQAISRLPMHCQFQLSHTLPLPTKYDPLLQITVEGFQCFIYSSITPKHSDSDYYSPNSKVMRLIRIPTTDTHIIKLETRRRFIQHSFHFDLDRPV